MTVMNYAASINSKDVGCSGKVQTFPSVEQIFDEYRMIAIIIYSTHRYQGIQFFTPNNFSQQLAFMSHPKGHVVPAHIHLPVPRQVKHTQETLFVRHGKIRINFYNEQKFFIDSRVLETGDVILLVSGGHDIKVLQDTDIVEVKQGPYAGENDKMRFKGLIHDTGE